MSRGRAERGETDPATIDCRSTRKVIFALAVPPVSIVGMIVMQEVTHEWTGQIGRWPVGFEETETFAWGHTSRDTTIYLGSLTATFHLPAATVAWRSGGAALMAAVVIAFVAARLFANAPAGSRHG